jgi:hypothetical protein
LWCWVGAHVAVYAKKKRVVGRKNVVSMDSMWFSGVSESKINGGA